MRLTQNNDQTGSMMMELTEES